MVDTIWIVNPQAVDLTRRVRALEVFSEVLSLKQAYNRLSDISHLKGVIIAYDKQLDDEELDNLIENLTALKVKLLVSGFDFNLVEENPLITINKTNHISDELLNQFVFEVCQAQKKWQLEDFIERQVQQIQAEVKDQNVILGLSGGVDSSVVAALLDKAIQKQLTCIFIDHGLLRENEAQQVIEMFSDYDFTLVAVDAKQEFLDNLKGVSDPETKRKIIGETFIKVFEREASKIGDVSFLAQGTLYTDVIESGVGAHLVKSHHNVGGLPEKMNLKLIEPFNLLFKDEVRQVGALLKLNDEILKRQPFPGPGLAIRIIGDVTQEKIDIVQKSDTIFRRILKEEGLYDSIWQSFTVCTNIKSVGIDEGKRSYAYTVALRAINSIDGLNAEVIDIPIRILKRISSEITTKLKNVNRVVYDVTNKPPATIEWE